MVFFLMYLKIIFLLIFINYIWKNIIRDKNIIIVILIFFIIMFIFSIVKIVKIILENFKVMRWDMVLFIIFVLRDNLLR